MTLEKLMIKITIYNWKKIVFKGILYVYNYEHYFYFKYRRIT